ncbi:MAG: HD-GYP domain-containing protein [Armatimonadetes bacterium]|nr:HD-GYP domain-containing protein [Armatimonadota bacterium]
MAIGFFLEWRGVLPIQFAARRVCITLSDSVFLAAIFLFGFGRACLLVLVVVVFHRLLMDLQVSTRPPLGGLTIVFTASQAYCAYALGAIIVDYLLFLPLFFRATVAGLVVVNVNFWFMTVSLSLDHGISLRTLWRHWQEPLFVNTAMLIPLGILLALLYRQAPLAAPLLAVPLLFMYFSFKGYEKSIEESQALFKDLARTVDERDEYTSQHSHHVATYAAIIAREMELDEHEVKQIEQAGEMHDVGKVGIRDDVLLKPGRLVPEEFEHIKEHARITGEILGKLSVHRQQKLDVVAGGHHERWDGAGYPSGLKGEEIPLGSRILAVADVFDAMTCRRAYRGSIAEGKVVQTIEDGAGTQFDPRVVNAFLNAHESGAFTQYVACNRLWSIFQSFGYSYEEPLPARRDPV